MRGRPSYRAHGKRQRKRQGSYRDPGCLRPAGTRGGAEPIGRVRRLYVDRSPSVLHHSALGLICGCMLGIVLVRQGGISIPSRQQGGASTGALVGLVVGVVAVLLLGGPVFGLLGICVLVGLAVGRAFDRRSIHSSA
jgi:hypothetical protein